MQRQRATGWMKMDGVEKSVDASFGTDSYRETPVTYVPLYSILNKGDDGAEVSQIGEPVPVNANCSA